MKYIICLLFLSCTIQYTQAQTNNSKPIPWEYIKPEDMLWKKRVWRQIDLREKNNAPLSNDPLIPKENVFANVLLRGLKNGIINAYTGEDTGFKDPLPITKIDSIIQCRQECIYPRQVAFYQIAEDWIFDRKAGQMIVRIRAIAPATNVNGNIKPLFWLYYPDIRQYLANYETHVGKETYYHTWDEYFESRQFSSKITRVEPSQVQEIQENESGKKHKKKKRKEKIEIKEGNIFDSKKDQWVY